MKKVRTIKSDDWGGPPRREELSNNFGALFLLAVAVE